MSDCIVREERFSQAVLIRRGEVAVDSAAAHNVTGGVVEGEGAAKNTIPTVDVEEKFDIGEVEHAICISLGKDQFAKVGVLANLGQSSVHIDEDGGVELLASVTLSASSIPYKSAILVDGDCVLGGSIEAIVVAADLDGHPVLLVEPEAVVGGELTTVKDRLSQLGGRVAFLTLRALRSLRALGSLRTFRSFRALGSLRAFATRITKGSTASTSTFLRLSDSAAALL